MNIVTRKCDICGTRHDNDTAAYWLFGKLIDANGQESDVCPACMPARADVPAGT
jgi:hypothetical protein